MHWCWPIGALLGLVPKQKRSRGKAVPCGLPNRALVHRPTALPWSGRGCQGPTALPLDRLKGVPWSIKSCPEYGNGPRPQKARRRQPGGGEGPAPPACILQPGRRRRRLLHRRRWQRGPGRWPVPPEAAAVACLASRSCVCVRERERERAASTRRWWSGGSVPHGGGSARAPLSARVTVQDSALPRALLAQH